MAQLLAQGGAAPPGEAEGFPRPPRTIVALPALAFVVPSLVFMLAAVVGGWLWALEFGHIAYGAAWTIIDLVMGFIVGPMLGRMPVRARLEVITRLMPQLSILLPTLVTVTLVCGFQLALHLGVIYEGYLDHVWVLASYAVVGVMTIVALGVNEPANLAVLFELRKPRPNVDLIDRLMRRFVYSAGILGLMQLGILIIMSRLAV